MINIEYEKYVNHNLGIFHNGRRVVIGEFREKGSKKIIKEELKILNCGNDVEKSYKATISYFNHTITKDDEKERTVVSAKWKPKEDTV